MRKDFVCKSMSLFYTLAFRPNGLRFASSGRYKWIGEQIEYILQVKADSTAQITFSRTIFASFEVLEESPINTLRTATIFLPKICRYSLTLETAVCLRKGL